MKRFTLHGRLSFRPRSLYQLMASALVVAVQRAVRGPQRPGWTAQCEMATHFWRCQTRYAFDLADLNASREFFDTVQFHDPVLERIAVEREADPTAGTPEAQWVVCLC